MFPTCLAPISSAVGNLPSHNLCIYTVYLQYAQFSCLTYALNKALLLHASSHISLQILTHLPL